MDQKEETSNQNRLKEQEFRKMRRGTKMAAQVDTLRLLAQPELTENRTARGTDTKEIENKHSSRPVGGVETGTWVERTPVAVVGPRLAECGKNGAGSLSTSRPCGPTFAHR